MIYNIYIYNFGVQLIHGLWHPFHLLDIKSITAHDMKAVQIQPGTSWVFLGANAYRNRQHRESRSCTSSDGSFSVWPIPKLCKKQLPSTWDLNIKHKNTRTRVSLALFALNSNPCFSFACFVQGPGQCAAKDVRAVSSLICPQPFQWSNIQNVFNCRRFQSHGRRTP